MERLFKRVKTRRPLDTQALKTRRIALGLSMAEAGRHAGFNHKYPAQQWNQYESGSRPYPNPPTLRDLARVVGCQINDIMPGLPTDDEPTPQTEYDRGHARGCKKGHDDAIASMHDGCSTEGEIAAAFDRGVRHATNQTPTLPPGATDADILAAYDAGNEMGRTVGYEQGRKVGYDAGHLTGYAAGIVASQVNVPEVPTPNSVPVVPSDTVKSIYDILG